MDWMYVLKAVVLGIVEGLTEFLPVSSTGHLILAADLLDFPKDAFYQMFLIVVQLFSIIAVIILFFGRLWKQVKGFFCFRRESLHFVFAWILGCIPAAVLGLLFNDWIEEKLMSAATVAVALLAGAFMLLLFERFAERKARTERMEDIRFSQALGVGFFQCLSLWPGFSRSASTIMGGWAVGLKTKAAADYSFFLAIPIMLAASGYSLFKYVRHGVPGMAAAMTREQFFALVFGCLASLAVALAVVRLFMGFLKKHRLAVFAYYRIVLAFVLMLLLYLGPRGGRF